MLTTDTVYKVQRKKVKIIKMIKICDDVLYNIYHIQEDNINND